MEILIDLDARFNNQLQNGELCDDFDSFISKSGIVFGIGVVVKLPFLSKDSLL